jgi:hypothetical protein
MVDALAAPSRFRDPFAPEPWARVARRIAPDVRPDPALVNNLKAALLRGDPDADALVAWMREVGAANGRGAFEAALEGGIDSVPSPAEPLRRFFEAIDTVPVWLDRAELARACRVYDRTSFAGEYVLFMSLLGGYVSAGVTKTLVRTGGLTRSAARRMAETAKFVDDITRSLDLSRFSDGFKTTVRVRLMHAHVRAALLSKDWDVARWGVPINQADMAATLVQFSSAYVLGVQALGFIVPRRDREAVAHLWRYVGRLLGVEDALLPATDAEGRKLLRLSIASQQGPDADGRALATALLEVPAIRERGRYPAWLTALDVEMRAGMTRLAIGAEAADELALPDTPWKYAPFSLVPAVFCAELCRSVVPGATAMAEKFGRRLTARRVERWLGGKAAKYGRE